MPRETKVDEKTELVYSLTASTLEDIDRALFAYLDEELDIFCDTNKGFEKVPVVFAGQERAYQIKDNPTLRQGGRTIIFPMISLGRTSMTKNPAKKGRFGVYLYPYHQFYDQGGAIDIARVVQQEKTRDRANADAIRKTASGKNISHQTFPGETSRVVYETLSIPTPTYVELGYSLVIKTEYQQQMNDILAAILASTPTPAVFNIKHKGNTYEAFIEPEYSQENNATDVSTELRIFQSTVSITVLGYLIGSGKNQETPVVVQRQGAAEIKLQRERVIVGDEIQYHPGKKLKYRP